jgi:spore coat polysaccharide biosynthesis protein SpsF
VRAVRGHATDRLDRHAQAARETRADAIVRIPSDCPLIDPATIDRVVGAFVRLSDIGPVDFVSNLHPPTWPAGFDVEVVTRGALEAAWREAATPHDRAHVTPYLRRHPARFAVRNACRDGRDGGLDLAHRYRLALEYAEDYAVIRGVYDDLWSARRHFTLAEILAVLAARPALHARNAMHASTWFRAADALPLEARGW